MAMGCMVMIAQPTICWANWVHL